MIAKTTRILQRSLGAGVLAVGLGACGSSAPTNQLVDARRAYDQAEMSPAAKLTPDHLLTARRALEAAEDAHKNDPGSEEEVHLAYLATRKAQQAASMGKIADAKQSEARANGAYVSSLEKGNTQGKEQLSKERTARETAETERKAADERAAKALASLAELGQVKQEERGTVLTISGAVLFPENKSVLSTPARQSLDRVAQALLQQPPQSKIRVEGYTDARGSDAHNEQLSQARAQAVRDYLVQQGLDASELEAIGRGEANPIASNDTAEGRATNRRVEIIIPPQTQAKLQAGPSQIGVAASK